MYPATLERLVEYFKLLPSVGQKNAERYAMRILEMDPQTAQDFAGQIVKVIRSVKRCPVCGNLTEKEVCEICSDNSRDKSVICVVEEAKDVIAIEKLEQYHGLYHVLNGVISPSKGVMPEDINIESLFARLNEDIKEIVIATNATLEGETTASYLTKVLKKYPYITITRLASGLPMGSNLDYADPLTLLKAFNGRIKQ